MNYLPYLISFLLLLLISLGLLTWLVSLVVKEETCVGNPDIWCSDGWSCDKNCPASDVTHNACYGRTGATGLASCLFGPTSALATTCSSSYTGGTGPYCGCPSSLQGQVSNCLAGCSSSTSNTPGLCCCNPRDPKCKYTVDNYPPECLPTNS